VRAKASRFAGGWRVGADFFARGGLVVTKSPPPRGVVDRMDDLRNGAIDTARVAPALVVFFEDTSGLALHIRSRWRFPFSIAWRVGRVLARWMGQLVLPRNEARIRTEAFALDARDGRADARAIIRTYDGTGEVMQAMAYATWERDGTRYMSAAFPVPGACLMGLLRLDAIAEHEGEVQAVALTSARRDGDDAGVWLVRGRLAIPMPLGERLELWAPGTAGAPAEDPPPGLPEATILGRHEQRFLGILFVTHYYWFWPVAS